MERRVIMFRCPECRQSVPRKRSDQVTCGAKCAAGQKNREMNRARVLYRALYWSRKDRSMSGDCLAFIHREVAAWMEEDTKSQRLPPPKPDFGRDRGLSTGLAALRTRGIVQPKEGARVLSTHRAARTARLAAIKEEQQP